MAWFFLLTFFEGSHDEWYPRGLLGKVKQLKKSLSDRNDRLPFLLLVGAFVLFSLSPTAKYRSSQNHRNNNLRAVVGTDFLTAVNLMYRTECNFPAVKLRQPSGAKICSLIYFQFVTKHVNNSGTAIVTQMRAIQVLLMGLSSSVMKLSPNSFNSPVKLTTSFYGSDRGPLHRRGVSWTRRITTVDNFLVLLRLPACFMIVYSFATVFLFLSYLSLSGPNLCSQCTCRLSRSIWVIGVARFSVLSNWLKRGSVPCCVTRLILSEVCSRFSVSRHRQNFLSHQCAK